MKLVEAISYHDHVQPSGRDTRRAGAPRRPEWS